MTHHPTIGPGSKGDAVREAQRELQARGYWLGNAGVDGIYGPYTTMAVVNYQFHRSVGQYWALKYPLAVDGWVGPQTWGRLAPDTIRRGSTGTGVTLLQSILHKLAKTPPENPSWDPGPIDGIFGPMTENAVRNYQNDLGLTVDGIVGPLTWRSLWS